ncbi:MAG: DUF3667 domain-containing protein [Kangiellaceae bacterium]|jgi:hypothetical protein|nr:DUF3667 domain-containing protein [Kangiellaceae bacterium]
MVDRPYIMTIGYGSLDACCQLDKVQSIQIRINVLQTNCSNCQTPLTGQFCVNCGQPARDRRGPVWRMIGEFTDDLFTFDSKFYKSILHLLVRPGYLTKQFVEGKRVAILPPIRMYLVVSVLFFFIFEIPTVDVSNTNVYLGNTLLGQEKPNPKFERNFSMFNFGSEESTMGAWFESFYADRIPLMKSTSPQITMNQIFNRLESTLPNALILFVPVFALVLKLLYLFKRRLYFDHFIFSVHFQTWLMGITLIIYSLAVQNIYWAWLSAIVSIYLARAQKVVYEQSYWLIVPKTFTIIVVYFTLYILALVVALLTSVMMFEINTF